MAFFDKLLMAGAVTINSWWTKTTFLYEQIYPKMLFSGKMTKMTFAFEKFLTAGAVIPNSWWEIFFG